MKVGDLVRYKRAATTQVGKVYLIIEMKGFWVRLFGNDAGLGSHITRDFEVVSESR